MALSAPAAVSSGAQALGDRAPGARWLEGDRLVHRLTQVAPGGYGDLALGQLEVGQSWEDSRRPRSFASRDRAPAPRLPGARPSWVTRRRRYYAPPTASPLPATSGTTTAPPVVWFPDLSDECEQPTKSYSSFNAFGFLAFVLSAVNLVSLLSSNVNNNINNNNNNNNNNDNNDINTNEDNANTNQNVLNQVMIAPGRRRRQALHEDSSPTEPRRRSPEAAPVSESSDHDAAAGEDAATWQPDPEEVSLLVVFSFLLAWSEATVTGDRCCALRAVCEARAWGRELGALGDTLADVLR